MEHELADRRAVVIEDDADVRMLLARTLQRHGFEVAEAATGAEGLRLAREHEPDLVTLDLNLPDLDGTEVCRRLREFSDAYVVMITGRAEEIDELIGLQIGADDYISKPFSPRTVQARVEAMFRRPRATAPKASAPDAAGLDHPGPPPAPPVPLASTGFPASAAPPARAASPLQPAPAPYVPAPYVPATQSPAPEPPAPEPPAPDGQRLAHGPLVVDLDARVVEVDGKEVALTRTEFDLLALMVCSPRRVWTREMLLRSVWGDEWASDEHLVEVHVGNLRRKLGDRGRSPRFIRTVRGVGYGMMAPQS
ncbi:response regulator transcription factor [Sinomonas mesophila]|uniref:response regulator transcription factor n=1 Tax=Sinomonas mesophila TaxID=1531955 RepID=UPI0009865AA8|nr:response regulator transcription factor [Sinomonas mesophila]